jgi:LytS/YehU family sensor histidine kinase
LIFDSSNFALQINNLTMQKIIKNRLTIVGILIGVIGGYLYYAFVGCASGTCAITSSPIISSLYGGLMGGLLFNMFEKETQK